MAHPASHTMSNGSSLPWTKADHSLLSSAKVKYVHSLLPHLPLCLHVKPKGQLYHLLNTLCKPYMNSTITYFITFISWNLSPPQLQYTPSCSGTPDTLVCLNTTVGAGLIIHWLVSIATYNGLDGPGIESQWWRDFLHPSRPALGPTQPPIH